MNTNQNRRKGRKNHSEDHLGNATLHRVTLAGLAALLAGISQIAWATMPAPQSATSQGEVVMRRPLPGPGRVSSNPDQVAPTPTQTPTPAASPTPEPAAACDPATQECEPRPEYFYGWQAECSKPPVVKCQHFAKTFDPNSRATVPDAACLASPPATGFGVFIFSYPAGRKPTQQTLFERCGFRDEYDHGWLVDCDKGTTTCIGNNSYTQETREFSDASCTTPGSSDDDIRAQSIGLRPRGSKPDTEKACNAKVTARNFGPWKVLTAGYGVDTIDAAPALVCAGLASRSIDLACTYQDKELGIDGDPECQLKVNQFITEQYSDYGTSLARTSVASRLVESRGMDDPLIAQGCDWKYVNNTYSYMTSYADSESPAHFEYSYGACYATNAQDYPFEFQPGAGENGGYASGLAMDPFDFAQPDCNGGKILISSSPLDTSEQRWINYLGDRSSPNEINRPRTYCSAYGPITPQHFGLNDSPNYGYNPNDYGMSVDNGACGALPNPGYENDGR